MYKYNTINIIPKPFLKSLPLQANNVRHGNNIIETGIFRRRDNAGS